MPVNPHEFVIAAVSVFGDGAFYGGIQTDIRRSALEVLKSIGKIDDSIQEEQLEADEPVPEKILNDVYNNVTLPLLGKFESLFGMLRSDERSKFTGLDTFKKIGVNMAEFSVREPPGTYRDWRLESKISKHHLRLVSDGLAVSLDDGPCLKILIPFGWRKPREIVVCK